MALTVELWVAGRPVGGMEVWWEEYADLLAGTAPTEYPLLRHVDAYGDFLVDRDTARDFRAEVTRFHEAVPDRAKPALRRLAELCERVNDGESELRFVGD